MFVDGRTPGWLGPRPLPFPLLPFSLFSFFFFFSLLPSLRRPENPAGQDGVPPCKMAGLLFLFPPPSFPPDGQKVRHVDEGRAAIWAVLLPFLSFFSFFFRPPFAARGRAPQGVDPFSPPFFSPFFYPPPLPPPPVRQYYKKTSARRWRSISFFVVVERRCRGRRWALPPPFLFFFFFFPRRARSCPPLQDEVSASSVDGRGRGRRGGIAASFFFFSSPAPGLPPSSRKTSQATTELTLCG